MFPDGHDEDTERHDGQLGRGSLHIQSRLVRHLDEYRAAICWAAIRDRYDAPAVKLMRDLSHADSDHIWLWSLNPHRGVV